MSDATNSISKALEAFEHSPDGERVAVRLGDLRELVAGNNQLKADAEGSRTVYNDYHQTRQMLDGLISDGGNCE